MPFVQAKCPECGGMLAVDDSKKAAVCQFCGEAFIVQEAINNYITNNITNNNTTHNYGEGAVVNVYENQNSVFSLLKRAFMFLEDGDFESADVYCDKALDIEPESEQAYLGKLMSNLKVRKQEELKTVNSPFDGNINYQKILRFGNGELVNELKVYNIGIRERLEAENLAHKQKETTERLERQRREEAERLENENKKIERYNLIQQKRIQSIKLSNLFSASVIHTVGVLSDGTVIAVGSNSFKQCDVKDWRGIVAVSAGWHHTVGLKSDGTVVAKGENNKRQCNVTNWENIVSVSVGNYHTVGLKSNGTVVATKIKMGLLDIPYGSAVEDKGQCDVTDWTDIVAVSAGDDHTVGLKSDGTVISTKYKGCKEYYYGQCDVQNWTDIVAVSAGYNHTVGLKSDGTVVATKYIGKEKDYHGQCGVQNWTDIVAVSAGYNHTVGLKSDGTVVATKYIGKEKDYHGQCDVQNWTDIVAVSAGCQYTVGLKADGTVVATKYIGEYYHSQCDVENWKLF